MFRAVIIPEFRVVSIPEKKIMKLTKDNLNPIGYQIRDQIVVPCRNQAIKRIQSKSWNITKEEILNQTCDEVWIEIHRQVIHQFYEIP